MRMIPGVVIPSHDLVPDEWRRLVAGPLRVFNPGLVREGDGWILACRVVLEPDLRRRIVICRLDENFCVVPGSVQPLSDLVRFPSANYLAPEATAWFADPRLYRLSGRLFIYWNSGWHEPRNYQFLQELDAKKLTPLSGPRELTLTGERRKLEKNWMLFGEDRLFAIYSVHPHRVLEGSLDGEEEIEFHEIALTDNAGGHAQDHGGLRGGAPPQRAGGHFYSFCHSVHDAPEGYRYVASAYRFAGQFPFAPTDMPVAPLTLPRELCPPRKYPKLNPAVGEVIYPSGAVADNGRWVLSYGVNDECCAIATLRAEDVAATLRPVEQP